MKSGGSKGAQDAVAIARDLERILAPADLVPALPLVQAHYPVAVMHLVLANPPLAARSLIAALPLVPALLSGEAFP